MFVGCCMIMGIQNSYNLTPLPVGGLAQCRASWEKSAILPQFFSQSNKVSRVYFSIVYSAVLFDINVYVYETVCCTTLFNWFIYFCIRVLIFPFGFVLIYGFYFWPLFRIRAGTFPWCVQRGDTPHCDVVVY